MAGFLTWLSYYFRTAKRRTAAALGVAKDTLFTDTSEFQRSIYTRSYPYSFGSFRANDGTYRDHKFAGNLAYAKWACDTGRWTGFIVYFVWRENWQATVATLKDMVGRPHPKMVVMIDVESWGGALRGNHSAGINAARENLIKWLGGNRRRVIGYANAGDFDNLWPTRGDAKVILANYSSNPPTPKHIAHQFTSSANVAPFGHPVDLNSADGYTPQAFASALGIAAPPAPAHKPTPTPSPKPTPKPKPKLRRAWPKSYTGHHVFGWIKGPAWEHGGATAGERANVRAIQRRLQVLGFAPTKNASWVSGIYRLSTINSVKRFQKAHKLSQTGRVNHTTWNRMFTY